MTLRLRMKVYTDDDGKRWLVPLGMSPPSDFESPATSPAMTVYLMRDDETKIVKVTVDQWNAMPFYWFGEQGEAPRREARRPFDAVKL